MFFNLIYGFGLLLISPIIAYRMIRFGRYRQGIKQKLCGLSRDDGARLVGNAQHVIWLHAVSVGEVGLLPELTRRIARDVPNATIVVSTSTDTGMAVARQHFDGHVFFCPVDFTWSVRRTLKHLRCDQLILVELELWPNLIAAAKSADGQVNVVNARMSEKSSRGYQWFQWFLKPAFGCLDHVSCQDDLSAKRFEACGVPSERISVTGSLKFDNAPHSRDVPGVTERINWSGAEPWHRIWCFGSTQAGEEAMALRVYESLRKQHPELRLILAPRHAERFDKVADLITKADLRSIRRSHNHDQYADLWESDEVILIDTLGELRLWWGVAEIATVGGSFGHRGGQNMLEPAGYGSAVSFGPNTTNFSQIAGELIRDGGAVRVSDEASLHRFVERCLNDPPAADQLGRHAKQTVQRHRGAHDKTMHHLITPLPEAARAA